LNFEEDLKLQFAGWLSANGYPGEGDLQTLVRRYRNITRRIPACIEWELQVSRNLAAKSLPKKIEKGLAHFMEQARGGADLRPFLSDKIDCADYRDLMFYDWSIYHFHLGTKLAKEGKRRGFIEGTDDLLFAIADRETATMYLINTHPHEGGFTNQDLLRIIEENWPEILDRYTLHGVSPSYDGLSSEELGMLRSGGVNVVLRTPGGRTLAPMGGGITTDKSSFQDVRLANHLAWRARQAETEFQGGLASILRYFRREHGLDSDRVSFRAQLNAENTIRVGETTTGTPVWNEREGWLITTIEVDL